MMMNNVKKSIKQVARKILLPIPRHLAKNHIEVDGEGVKKIRESIKNNYHTGWRSEDNYSKEAYEDDLTAHLFGRLQNDRRVVVPWLDDIRPLRGQRILEIGCGTGSSSVALAEQGAKVIGVDIDEGALRVARDRCRVYGLDAEFIELKAQEIHTRFGSGDFDSIIFFASLEHMTIAERLQSLQGAWEILPPRGLLVIVETPNRLWYFDDHTSSLLFFHWLPDALAFKYARFSPRGNFNNLYAEYNEAAKEHFIRRGRGMSFHELDLSIGSTNDLKVVSSLSTFHGIRYKLRKSTLERQYKAFLMASCPHLHEGFFDASLDLIVEKS